MSRRKFSHYRTTTLESIVIRAARVEDHSPVVLTDPFFQRNLDGSLTLDAVRSLARAGATSLRVRNGRESAKVGYACRRFIFSIVATPVRCGAGYACRITVRDRKGYAYTHPHGWPEGYSRVFEVVTLAGWADACEALHDAQCRIWREEEMREWEYDRYFAG